MRLCVSLFILYIAIPLCLCIIADPIVTKGPRRNGVIFDNGNVLVGDDLDEQSQSRDSSTINRPRTTLLVHPGKAKPASGVDSRGVQSSTTRSPRVLTPPPTTASPTTNLANIFDADGCFLAVETPDQVFARHSVQVPATSHTIKPTTPKPNRLNVAERAPPRILTTTTTTTKRPTTTTTAKKPSFVVSCPKPNGLFRFETDCRKYINCWKGRPHVQTCADGTLFSAALGTCDHANKVDCQVSRAAGVTNPITTTPVPTTTTTRAPPITCPKRKGLFPHPSDCKKFINCWAGVPAVQVCAEGTLFNSETRECDHASKVVCLTTARVYQPEQSTEKPGVSFFNISDSARSSPVAREPTFHKVELELPLTPDSGQFMRLRGGAGPWEGYLEVRAGKDRPWGHVCDSQDSWTVEEASVICRHLGFLRGAQKSIQGLEFGPLTRDIILIEKVECTGSEANITGCKVYIGSNCPFIHQQVVGVRCERDPQSLCGPDEHAHGNACYKIIPDMTTHERARSICEESGGSLLNIHSQTENDFISELLIGVVPSVTKVHTDGVAVKALRKDLFLWEHSETAINFTKWWPEWNRSKTGNPLASSKTQCVLLRNRFEYRGRCATLPYFFWSLGECDVAAAAVCKKSPRDIGCVIGNGADYQGTANISKTGVPCLAWNDPRIRHVMAKTARAAVANLDSNSRRKPQSAKLSLPTDLNHNYCRNPHGESSPWCFISPVEMEYCVIPKCQVHGTSNCQCSCPTINFEQP